MTIDDILARHGLTRDDLSTLQLDIEDGEHVVYWGNDDKQYALVGDYPEMNSYEREMWAVLTEFGIGIVAFYPDARAYLVKRKAPKAIKLTASVDYRFGLDVNGNVVVEYKNFDISEQPLCVDLYGDGECPVE
jgi:hypothetical protein